MPTAVGRHRLKKFLCHTPRLTTWHTNNKNTMKNILTLYEVSSAWRDSNPHPHVGVNQSYLHAFQTENYGMLLITSYALQA